MLRLNYQIEKENRIMMKKMLRMLLLGFLTVTVLSPSVVTAEEDQTGQVPSSSVYSEIDGIAPMATPFIEEITLDNGESYELTKKCLVFADTQKITIVHYKIRSVSQEKEAFSVQQIVTMPIIDEGERFYYEAETKGSYITDPHYRPTTTEIHDGGIKITNYSSGPTKYRIGLNIVHHPEDTDFELG